MTKPAVPLPGGTSRAQEPHKAGADSVVAGGHPLSQFNSPLALAAILRIAVVGAAGALLGSGVWNALGHPRLFGLAAMLVGGYPIFKEAVDNVLERRGTSWAPAT